MGGICVEQCRFDGDCDGEDMCCSNGCGHVCMPGEEAVQPGRVQKMFQLCTSAWHGNICVSYLLITASNEETFYNYNKTLKMM